MKWIRPMRRAVGAALFCALGLALLSLGASAADLARLHNGFTIRHEHRQIHGTNTRLFLSAGDTSFIDVPTAEIEGFEKDLSLPPGGTSQQTGSLPAPDLNRVVTSASATYHLDPDLVNSVIHAESGFNSHAVSRKGAVGLMQLMPNTAGQLGIKNPFDPEANVGGGTRYLRQLLERYNFDLVKALAAYNAGPKRVEQYRGVPPYRETRAYVARIVHDYNQKKIAEEKQAADSVKAHPPTNTAKRAQRLKPATKKISPRSAESAAPPKS